MRAISSEVAVFIKQKGHEQEREFARLIGLDEGYKKGKKAKIKLKDGYIEPINDKNISYKEIKFSFNASKITTSFKEKEQNQAKFNERIYLKIIKKFNLKGTL